ncbi:unnamed protein product, partial [Brassica rapa subsp. trilocularis]
VLGERSSCSFELVNSVSFVENSSLALKLLDTLRAAGAIRSSPDEHDDAADENSYGGGYNNGGLTILDEHQAQFGGDGLISGGVGQVGDDDGFSISFD